MHVLETSGGSWRLGDADWWWEYALDGVMGGLMGGVVAGTAVWITVAHTRRMADVAAARLVCGKFLEAIDERNKASAPDAPREEHVGASLSFLGVVNNLVATVHPRWPHSLLTSVSDPGRYPLGGAT